MRRSRKPSKTRVPMRFPIDIKQRIRRAKKFVKVKIPLDTIPPSVLKGTYRRNPYPQVWFQGRSQGVHRVVWQLKRGPIPKGYVVHHKRGDKTNPNPSIRDLELVPKHVHASVSGAEAKKAL